ncbi:flagellar basal-body rod modification protein FlgD [Hydrogenivirga caldilitoris]|uniref:Flagellar basal-body rod modification protein FlgD n=1 Tax=Hydrogenivirga caldilitoris TaxID=246264 RepID=A0A497XR78_9AQUI|nr:flagellar hook assembly protein FlgD [Hydrogenivirga caldilitoris]RLJ71527.1 flagellar basal-body rod modification protein FlgD [Hydrogenivirga caldilitoris]
MIDNRLDVKPPEPKIVGPDYVQSFDTMSSEDFMKIYLETLKFQDPFNQQDLSKSLEDVVKLNQIKFYTDMKGFMEGFKAWMNQITFMQTISLIGKNFVFAADTLDTVKGGEYHILSGERVRGVTVKVYDGDEVIKEFEMDLERGLNTLDTSDLPQGQFTVKLFKGDYELPGWQLGFKDTVKSAGIVNGELMLDLLSGRQVSSSQIIYAEG